MESLKSPGSFIFLWSERCKNILSDRKTGYIIVFLVILCRALQLVYFFNTRNDMTYQILGAQHFINGHGLSYTSISVNDISNTVYQPLNQWPPGFSFLFIPFYLLFGKDYILAALALSIICAILLILVCRAILKVLDVPDHLINIFTIVTGFFGYYFYNKPCTDAIGVTFYIVSIYYALLLLKSGRNNLWNLVLLTLSLFICGFIKYLYIPALFVIPVFLVTSGLFNKNKKLWKNGLVIFCLLIIGFASFFIFQYNMVGSVGYIKEPERGFYPENLKDIFPFITGSFIKTDTIEMLGYRDILFITFQLISLIVFTGLVYYCFKRMLTRKYKGPSLLQDFFCLSILLSIVIIALLSYLSLTVAKEYGTWTYVEEPRYYGVLTVLLHISVFALYPCLYTARNSILKFLFPVLILLMLPEMIRGVIFTANRVQRMNKETYGWQYELKIQKEVDKIANDLRKEKNKNIVLTGSSDWMNLRASLYSHLPVFEDVTKLFTPHVIKTSRPVTLLVLIREDHIDNFKSFISLAGVQSEGTGYGFYFYSYDINP